MVLHFKGLNMLNRLLISLTVSMFLYSSIAYGNNYESAIKIFDTNDTITNKSLNGYRSPIFHTDAGYLYTGTNNSGYTSLYFLGNGSTVPVEIDIPVREKAKYNRSDWQALKKIAENLFIFHLESTDDVFYFDLKSKKLVKWQPYYKLKSNDVFTEKLLSLNQKLMSAISWISVLDNKLIVFSESGVVYSYDSNNDFLLRVTDGVESSNKLVQNASDYVFFEFDGVIYKTNGIDTNIIINEEGRNSLVYRDSGDVVSRIKHTAPSSDEVNKNVFSILFESFSFDTGKKTETLYVVNKDVTHKISMKDGFKYYRESGFVSYKDEFAFLISTPANVYYDKYEIQHCKIASVVTCDYIELFPEITQGLYYVTLFNIADKKVLVNAQYDNGKGVDSKIITINLNSKQVVDVNVNKNENISASIVAKSKSEIFLLTQTIFDSKYTLYKYNVSSNKVSESVVQNGPYFTFESLIHGGELYTFRESKVSESELDVEKFYGLYKLNENSKLLNLIFQSNFGRETDNLNNTGIYGINKVKGGVVSSSIRLSTDRNDQQLKDYIFKVDQDINKNTIYNGSISSWLDTDEGFVFVANNTAYKAMNGSVHELYKNSDSSEIRLLSSLSYSNGKVLFSSTSSYNSGYLLDIKTGDILPVLTPATDGYIVSTPIQCGDNVFYTWSNYDEVGVWKTDGLSAAKLNNISSQYILNFSVVGNNTKMLFLSYDDSLPAKQSILTLNCADLSVSEVFKSSEETANVSINKNERGDIFFTVASEQRNDIYFLNEKDLSYEHIYSGLSSNYNEIFYFTHLIHRTINGFYYTDNALKDKQLVAIPSPEEAPTISSGNGCESNFDDSKGWIVCALTIKNDDGLLEDVLRIFDTSTLKYIYVELNYLKSAANIDNLTYSNGRYFFNAKIVGIGNELLAIDQNCFYELYSGADSCTLPLPNSTPQVYDHKKQSYYQGQYVYLPIRVVDEDLDILTFKISNQNGNWLSISNDGVVTGTVPTSTEIGTYSFTVDIFDGNTEVSKEIELEVLKSTINTEAPKPSINENTDQGGGGGSMSASVLLLLYLLSFYNRKSGVRV
ncbi:MAG: hypothetical protein ACI88H_002852 [Cocleimonas sp.]|jgi:hypothetical protein